MKWLTDYFAIFRSDFVDREMERRDMAAAARARAENATFERLMRGPADGQYQDFFDAMRRERKEEAGINAS